MTTKELTDLQRSDGIIRLSRQGLFLRGYNEGAMMLEHLMGYKVYRAEMKSAGGMVCFAGFPSECIEKVIGKIEQTGGQIIKRDEMIVEVDKLKYQCNNEKIASYPLKEKTPRSEKNAKQNAKNIERMLADALRKFDLDNATPVQAVLFMGKLKEMAGAPEPLL